MSGPLRATKAGVVLALHVQPGARREGVAGLHGDRLRLKVAPPPEDGRANARVLELVGELFAIRARDVVIAAGESSRSKDVLLGDLDLPSAQARLAALLEGGRPDGSRTRRRLPEGGRGD